MHRRPSPGALPLVVLALSFVATACAQGAQGALPSGSAPNRTPTASPSPSATSASAVVPHIRYTRLDLARIEIRQAGLKLKVVDEQVTLRYQPDTILTQDPRANEEVRRKSTVKVTIAVPPDCHPAYPTVCIPPFQGRITCEDLFPTRNFTVKPPDPYRLDQDGDGIGCERRR